MKRTAKAIWNGTGKDGKGNLTTQSTVLNKSQYSYNTRFDDGIGTNPEELVAAAHAGCFTMKLSFVIADAGFTPEDLTTDCAITFENGSITESHLTVHAKVTGISKDKFMECANDAKKNCPISMLLNTKITMEAILV